MYILLKTLECREYTYVNNDPRAYAEKRKRKITISVYTLVLILYGTDRAKNWKH